MSPSGRWSLAYFEINLFDATAPKKLMDRTRHKARALPQNGFLADAGHHLATR